MYKIYLSFLFQPTAQKPTSKPKQANSKGTPTGELKTSVQSNTSVKNTPVSPSKLNMSAKRVSLHLKYIRADYPFVVYYISFIPNSLLTRESHRQIDRLPDKLLVDHLPQRPKMIFQLVNSAIDVSHQIGFKFTKIYVQEPVKRKEELMML